MRYIYCKECKAPIGARSTFHEAVVLGKAPRKENKPVCGKSHSNYCLDCYIKIRKKLNKVDCDQETCRQMKDNECQYLVKG